MTGQIDIGLLRAARKEFIDLILPSLDGDRRYTGAMLRRALDVLLAQAEADRPADAALEEFGGAGALAHALRRREQPDSPALRAALRAYVEARLTISNPRFLKQSRETAKGPQA